MLYPFQWMPDQVLLLHRLAFGQFASCNSMSRLPISSCVTYYLHIWANCISLNFIELPRGCSADLLVWNKLGRVERWCEHRSIRGRPSSQSPNIYGLASRDRWLHPQLPAIRPRNPQNMLRKLSVTLSSRRTLPLFSYYPQNGRLVIPGNDNKIEVECYVLQVRGFRGGRLRE